ncbi:hypothetical protein CTI12_AA199580 [Artemisia annua]|uniref:RRM domain-containing protein n=1 Tax=Artemisia annua TaxID=35608 RepID=A0A2U1P289_ARTAN|nr:hypothetical protein CTI12_AA199580 [Artemisia annua]
MGDDDWNEATRKNRGYRTKEDDLAKVSISIYVTNFPESCSAKDLFQSCKVYGHVVDSYIPLKRSKSRKRFGFIRFINVFSVERLISNLCTIWIGKFRLHANTTRFQRPSVNTNSSSHSGKWNYLVRNKDKDGRKENISHSDEKMNRGMNYDVQPPSNSFVSTVKGSSTPLLAATLPAIVLDEECLVDRDLDNSVMGEVLHFSSLNNLRVLLYNEGFADVEIMYLGGLWVDIDGVPLNAWSRKSFHKIGSKWGEVMDVEDSTDDMFARKRLCIKTNLVHNILDSFKIIVKGKVFTVRAKELFVWSPSFKDVPEVIQYPDVNSFKNAVVNDFEDIPGANVEEESNCEAISDTCFGDSEEVPVKEKENIQSVNDKEVSKDPFGIYDIFNRSKVGVNSESSIPYPPGFTPEVGNKTTMFANISQEVQQEQHKSASCSSRVFEEVENSDIYVQYEGKGGRTKEIRKWVADFKSVQSSCIKDIKKKLCDIDKILDQGGVTDDVLLSRMEIMKQLHDLNSSNNIDFVQKAKVRWAIEGDENTKFFHGVINRKRANLSVKGIMIDGVWVDDPSCVKEEFRYHFEERFNDPGTRRGSINFRFPNRLSIDQIADLNQRHSSSNVTYPSIWKSILKEFYSLKVQGIDIFSHCKIMIGNGLCTRFWKDRWLDNTSLADSFPRLFALETDIDISVAAKLQSIVASFRRSVRGGVEDHQLQQLVSMLDSVILFSSNDRWICDLNGDGIFRVKDIRNLLDEFFLPKVNVPTRWVNVVLIKINIFAWKLALDRLPTRANLTLRGVVSDPLSCPICELHVEDSSHLFFNCSLAKDVIEFSLSLVECGSAKFYFIC